MAHARTTIRKAAVAILTAEVAITAPVLDNRVWYTPNTSLPVLGVYANSESIDLDQSSFDADYRELELTIQIIVEDQDGLSVADAADDLAELVEKTLRADRTLGVNVQDVLAPDTEATDDVTSEKVVRTLELVFPVYYRTAPGNAGLII